MFIHVYLFDVDVQRYIYLYIYLYMYIYMFIYIYIYVYIYTYIYSVFSQESAMAVLTEGLKNEPASSDVPFVCSFNLELSKHLWATFRGA